jgi:uncharacterized protein (TIGR00304 family)
MNRFHLLGFLFLFISIIIISLGIIQGDISFGVIVFIPFVIGQGSISVVGFLALVMSFLLFSLAFFKDNIVFHRDNDNGYHRENLRGSSEKESKLNVSGIILVGPIPFVFGSTRRMVVSLFILSLLFIILFWLIIPMFLK